MTERWYREDNYVEVPVNKRKMSARRILELCITIPLTILPLATAITTLIFMGHNQHWQIIHDELIAAPIIVVGFGTALVMFILTCCIAGE
jgi:ABC-type Fe3+ transport system permease subunit